MGPFLSRQWTAIRDSYGLVVAEPRTMDDGTLMYQAIGEGAVDLISAYTTDPSGCWPAERDTRRT